ncbi:hypothetical protein [Nocardia sp. Marseille-Q1738]
MTSRPYEILLDTMDPASRRETTLPELDRAPDPWETSMELRARTDTVRERFNMR